MRNPAGPLRRTRRNADAATTNGQAGPIGTDEAEIAEAHQRRAGSGVGGVT
jgi:hypothetical protein